MRVMEKTRKMKEVKEKSASTHHEARGGLRISGLVISEKEYVPPCNPIPNGISVAVSHELIDSSFHQDQRVAAPTDSYFFHPSGSNRIACGMLWITLCTLHSARIYVRTYNLIIALQFDARTALGAYIDEGFYQCLPLFCTRSPTSNLPAGAHHQHFSCTEKTHSISNLLDNRQSWSWRVLRVNSIPARFRNHHARRHRHGSDGRGGGGDGHGSPGHCSRSLRRRGPGRRPTGSASSRSFLAPGTRHRRGAAGGSIL